MLTPPPPGHTPPEFLKVYMDIARRFPEAVLMQILGDESPDTRRLMVKMKVKVGARAI